MTERFSGDRTPLRNETPLQRRWRHFQHYYLSAIYIAMGVYATGIFIIPEAQRIIQGDFGMITDQSELEKILSLDTKVVTNPDNKPYIDSQGGWLIDALMGSGIASSASLLGYGIYYRRSTRDSHQRP